MKEKLYTVGEIAKLAGVSLRTIRFYDVKGLLKPVSYSEAGYRYYNQQALTVLQRILMLKYLGFSLQKIEEILQGDEEGMTDMNSQLSQQKALLLEKRKHLEKMIGAIEVLEKSRGEERWQYLLGLLNLMTEEEKILEQYRNPANLEKRIHLHDYSTSERKWTDWVYERLELKAGQKVLELGCGTGLLWVKNIHRLPERLHLVLTDRSEEMLGRSRRELLAFREVLKEREITVEYCVMDANELQLAEEEYDCIIANHMLYHVSKRKECLQQITLALKGTGTFFCATNGERHLQELHELVADFDEQIELPFMHITSGFRLENGGEQLRCFFREVCMEEQKNDLIVDDVEAIYDYVYSYPGNAPYILEQRGEEFRRMLKEKLEREGAIYIQKSAGMFICKK